MQRIKEIDKQELAEDIARELKTKPSIVRKVAEFQFQKLSEHIRDEEDSFKLPYIGKVYRKFKPKENHSDFRNFDF